MMGQYVAKLDATIAEQMVDLMARPVPEDETDRLDVEI